MKLIAKQNAAINYFKSSYNCAQSVFTVFGKTEGISENNCLRISSGFGGGMGHLQHTCGAVTGAFMALGLEINPSDKNSKITKNDIYELVKKFSEEFTKRNKSISCRQLLGYDMNTPEGQYEINRLNLYQNACEKYIKDAVEIVENLRNSA